jgi:multiple sugar transport system ATP-binding protein
MNFIPGRLSRENGQTWVEAAGGTRLPLATNSPGQHGQEVVYGVRPKNFRLGEKDDPAGVEINVGVVEPTGDEVEVISELAGEPICVVFSERYEFRPEQQIRICPALDTIHLFDAGSGRRLAS